MRTLRKRALAKAELCEERLLGVILGLYDVYGIQLNMTGRDRLLLRRKQEGML